MKHRITKYNPENRDSNGVYQIDEWTAYSDIGKVFNEKELILKDYLMVETKYVKAVLSLFNSFNIENFRVSKLEKHNSKADFLNGEDMDILFPVYQKTDKNELIAIDQLDFIVKLILREYMWGILISEDMKTSVSFGYDYYVYFEVQKRVNFTPILEGIKKEGLYVE